MIPRDKWPATLEELAKLLLKDVQTIQPNGPYFFAGHSFGATVCLEMARLTEAAGEKVALVVLLDPRSLPPVGADIVSAGFAESLALISQTVTDGSRYAEHFEELSRVDTAEHDTVLQRLF